MGRRRYQKPSVHKTETKNKATQQWYFRARIDVLADRGEARRIERTYYLGSVTEMGKREAEKKRDEILSETINRPQEILASQIPFGRILDEFPEFAAAEVRTHTYANYESIVNVHLRRAFGNLRMCDLNLQSCKEC